MLYIASGLHGALFAAQHIVPSMLSGINHPETRELTLPLLKKGEDLAAILFALENAYKYLVFPAVIFGITAHGLNIFLDNKIAKAKLSNSLTTAVETSKSTQIEKLQPEKLVIASEAPSLESVIIND
ncbi:MAG: hypothetical protein K2X27_25435 [Candidatus Obscuribacterales bacterium]|nr:hypothetical protein [Candidatus Obscuribacterales bacterium]